MTQNDTTMNGSMKFLFLFLLGVKTVTAQFNFGAGANASLIRMTGNVSVRYDLKKYFINSTVEFGQFGRKKLDYSSGKSDGYGGIFNYFDYSGNYQSIGFKHDFKGVAAGLGFGRYVEFDALNKLAIGINCNYLFMTDHYVHYYYSSEATNNQETAYHQSIKKNTLELNLSVNYIRTLVNQKLFLNAGIVLPFIVPTLTNNDYYIGNEEYLPVSGFEPYLTLGIQYRLTGKNSGK